MMTISFVLGQKERSWLNHQCVTVHARDAHLLLENTGNTGELIFHHAGPLNTSGSLTEFPEIQPEFVWQ